MINGLYFVLFIGEEIAEIGNGVVASKSGVDHPGVIFLLDDLILVEGVLFAYSAFFRSDTQLRFQVWRPMPTNLAKESDRLFRLVGETVVIPSVIDAREDVSILQIYNCTSFTYDTIKLGVVVQHSTSVC